jgi:hypothetical protein
MIILQKIKTPDDLIDNWLKNQEYDDEYQLYSRDHIELLMEYWHKWCTFSDDEKELFYKNKAGI